MTSADATPAAAREPPRTDRPLIELRALAKSYHEGAYRRSVIHGLNAEIASGALVALLGRSGSGKSTLLNLLSGIDLPDAGEVRINGTSLTALSEQERTLFRRRHIGFVFQFFNLIPTLTVEENLLLPLELNGRLRPEQREQVRTLLEAVSLSDRADSFPDQLSGGEQQRVAIARALVHRPLLLLADEPTGNLDAETGREILELLIRLCRAGGITLLVVTHSDEVTRVVDRVLTLRDGQLAPGPGATVS